MEYCSLQLLCRGSCSPIQNASDCSWHQDQNFQVKMSLRSWVCSHPSCHSNPALVIIPFIVTPVIITPTKDPCKNCKWDTSVQIPEFLSLSLISSFQDLRDQFSKFSFVRTFGTVFCQHSGTMICSIYLSCHCLCVELREHCTVFENVLHRT